MSLIVKFVCFILVLGIAGLFVLKKPDGTPWLSVNEFIPDTSIISSKAASMVNTLKDTTNPSTKEAASEEIYRWQDQKGHWVYSDMPPTDQNAEVIHVTGSLNKDLAEKTTPTNTRSESTTATAESISTSIGPTSLSPEKISGLLEETKKIQQLMNNRQSQLDNAN
ncbi:hypothetical protein AB835_11055 [Candidatus Endobugula sertula]|uniref:DUF4124 domain-containing protein n=1 Tax=Candidatus Endobugula sertula TaxID=62101 RepID=A0A1D2QN61_9GAMM|nr:hypothetical protein AB835_11055 [Candidatus Endobugula sertula]